MSTLSFTFPVDVATAQAAVLVTAELHGCRVVEETPTVVVLRKGTLMGSLAFGFTSLYLRFRVELTIAGAEFTAITVRWKWNWWQGLPGYFRTRKAIRQFTESLRDGLQAWQEKSVSLTM
jgi:hypothetical protein